MKRVCGGTQLLQLGSCIHNSTPLSKFHSVIHVHTWSCVREICVYREDCRLAGISCQVGRGPNQLLGNKVGWPILSIIEIPTMLQPKKHGCSKANIGWLSSNLVTTVFLKRLLGCFWVVSTMDLVVTTIHQPASTGSCIFITTYCYSVQLFSFYS